MTPHPRSAHPDYRPDPLTKLVVVAFVLGLGALWVLVVRVLVG